MDSYDINTTVGDDGQIRVPQLPIAPGTAIAIKITTLEPSTGEVKNSDDDAIAKARIRMKELFGVVKGFRNSPRIPREELYERGRVS